MKKMLLTILVVIVISVGFTINEISKIIQQDLDDAIRAIKSTKVPGLK